MTTLKTISAALKLIDTKKENLKKAYDELQSNSSLLSSFPFSWSELDFHFTSIQNSLTQRFRLLESLESQNGVPSLNRPQTQTPIEPSSSSQRQTQSPKDPSPSSSKLPDQTQKDANLPALPNDPSSSKLPNQTQKDANLPALPNHPSSSLNQSGAGVFTKNFVETGSVMPRYELSVLCEKMDGKGLRNYVNKHLKDKATIQAELPGALRCAPDPAAMVLDSLDGFHVVNDMKEGELRKMRRSCIILLRQLMVLSPIINAKVREKAKALAEDWKGRLMISNTNVLVALGFLNFVAAFCLVSEFSMDELVDISVVAAVNEDFPELCRIIGMGDKVPDLVQKLISKGKHILAVKYVFEFKLANNIPPVPILKAFVDESKKLAIRLSQEGKSLNETTARETHALKSVIKIIENHKLEFEYPRASLEQRIEQLKKDRKQKTYMKHPAPASAAKPPQHQQQQLQQKRKMQKEKQQQSRIKQPRTSNAVDPAAVLKNVSSGNSTVHQYQRPPVQPSGLLPEHPNPYMSSPAMPFGMVAPTPTISPYTGPSSGPYGYAGGPMGPSGNPDHGGSHLNSSEPLVPSGYYDRVSAYGGYGLQHYYQASYYPQ